jgi:hypothetical protein
MVVVGAVAATPDIITAMIANKMDLVVIRHHHCRYRHRSLLFSTSGNYTSLYNPISIVEAG